MSSAATMATMKPSHTAEPSWPARAAYQAVDAGAQHAAQGVGEELEGTDAAAEAGFLGGGGGRACNCLAQGRLPRGSVESHAAN